MKVIVALIMLTCQNYLVYNTCVERHTECVETISSQKEIIERIYNKHLSSISEEEKLAAAFLYCKENLE